MSDLQFKSYVRELTTGIESAKNSEDVTGELDRLIERLKKSLEG